jgi:inosine/xanthosine triphosphate pyrophosphatase family protein/ribose 1,5-bisphosphokinase PhnN
MQARIEGLSWTMNEPDDPRELAVLAFQRLVNTHFYTSSVEKLLQARLQFATRGYDLKFFRGPREPYDEHYALGTRGLLRRAIEQVNTEFGVRSVFFVEDTSLRIEALSEDRDFPGVALKEWFAGTSFHELDALLRGHGNDRRATAKSDIALYIPSLSAPVYFHGEASGVVAKTAPQFEASPQYPWLSPGNFGGWFVPDGATRRIGEMSYEEFTQFDFRTRALDQLLDYIENLHAGLNLHPRFYGVQRRVTAEDVQPLLFPPDGPVVLLICGYKCSGKTTLMQYLGRREDVLTVEGSRFILALAARLRAPMSSAGDALALLAKYGWDASSAGIGDFIELRSPAVCVVSGCRTPEDIAHFRRRFPQTTCVLIEADPKLRFERHLARGREPHIRTMRQFLETDAEQDSFGLMRVGRSVADLIIRNEGDLSAFHRVIDRHLEQVLVPPAMWTPTRPPTDALHAALLLLDEAGGSATSAALAGDLDRSANGWSSVRARLSGLPEFVGTTRTARGTSYHLTARGRSLLEAFNSARRPA